jgi:hypothetical protein
MLLFKSGEGAIYQLETVNLFFCFHLPALLLLVTFSSPKRLIGVVLLAIKTMLG